MNPIHESVRTICMRIFYVLTLLLTISAAAEAGQWRVRARESFNSGQVNLGDGRGSLNFRGLSSDFSVGYEEPYKRLVGLTFQRGALTHGNESLTVTTVGVEGKIFPTERARYLFARAGLLAQALDPAGPPKDFWNYGFALGTGWEFPVKKVGLAPEIGGRLLWGARGRSVRTLYLSLGIHFYAFPGDGAALPK